MSQTQDSMTSPTTLVSPEEQEQEIAERRRDTELVGEEVLNNAFLVVGLGAVGAQVAETLAIMGVRRLTLVDFDAVESENMHTQLYTPQDVGLAKTVSLWRKLDHYQRVAYPRERAMVMTYSTTRFQATMGDSADVVFCCVDTMQDRKAIWEACQGVVSCFLESRVLGDTIRLLSVGKDEDYWPLYEKTLFPDEEAEPGRCTARMSCYGGTVAGGLLVSTAVHMLKGIEIAQGDGLLNLVSHEWTHENWERIGQEQAGSIHRDEDGEAGSEEVGDAPTEPEVQPSPDQHGGEGTEGTDGEGQRPGADAQEDVVSEPVSGG